MKNNQGSLQTPNEVGYEQTERIISCFPSEGKIESYSQVSNNKTNKINIYYFRFQ